MKECPKCGSKYGDNNSNYCEELYKIYDKNSVTRLDNVNGHLLAAQTRKMDILIEQNNRIISLLEKITNKP